MFVEARPFQGALESFNNDYEFKNEFINDIKYINNIK